MSDAKKTNSATITWSFIGGVIHLGFRRFRFVVLFFAFLNPLFSHAFLPDDDFQALRKQITVASSQSPLQGIAKADEVLAEYNNELAPAQRIRVLYLKSWFQISADEIERALDTLADTRELAREIEEPGILYSYYGMTASAFANLELYDLALENHLQAYQQAPLLNQPEFIHQTENNIGHVYLKIGLLDEAETYFQRFYDFAVSRNMSSQEATGLNNLGEVALLRGELDLAYQLHSRALEIRRDKGYKFAESWSLYNLGRVYAAQNQYPLAMTHLEQAIKSWSERGAESKTLEPKLVLVEILAKQNRFQEAVALTNRVIAQATEFSLYTPLQTALQWQSKLKRMAGDLTGAIEALDEYNVILAQFDKKQTSIGLAYMLSQTELQTKEMALRQLEQEHQVSLAREALQRQQAIIIMVSAFVIIAITLYFYFRLMKRKGQLQELVKRLENTQLRLVEAEKMRAMTTLVSGMAHQLNTPLGLVVTGNSTLLSMVQDLSLQFSEKKLTQKNLANFIGQSTELLALCQNNSEKAANLIQRFKMMSARLQTTELSQFALLPFLTDTLNSHTAALDRDIQVTVNGSDIDVVNYSAVLEKVVTQLVDNSVKHGFGENEKMQLSINVQSPTENELIIHYQDNGRGIPQEKLGQVFDPFYTTRMGEGSLGLGLNVIYNSVVHLMGGHIKCLEDSKGAHFEITIPVKVKNTRLD